MKIIAEAPSALRWICRFSCNSSQLIGAAYFQAAGEAKGVITNASKQGFS
jgi:hypothetical protein